MFTQNSVMLGVVLSVSLLAGCCHSHKPEAATTNSADVVVTTADQKTILTIPKSAGVTVETEDGKLTIANKAEHLYCYVWALKTAATLDAAQKNIATDIAGEFKDFKVTTSSDLTIGGKPAKLLVGTGAEADDGDPGHAEVLVFQHGDRFFLACVHGEHKPTEKTHQFMLDSITSIGK